MELQFKLADFEGPLDALLFLISKHKMNIYDVPIAKLLEQYTVLIAEAQSAEMEIRSEFLEMAARLVYLKTLSLLPKHDEEAAALKEELTGQLIEYRIIKETAGRFRDRCIYGELFFRDMQKIDFDMTYKLVHESDILLSAYLAAAGKGMRKLPPPVSAFRGIVANRVVSVTSKMNYVAAKLLSGEKVEIDSLYGGSEDRGEIVATFLAVLELLKGNRVILSTDGKKIHRNSKVSFSEGFTSEMDG